MRGLGAVTVVPMARSILYPDWRQMPPCAIFRVVVIRPLSVSLLLRVLALISAYQSDGYNLAEIACYVGLHYTTVSRMVLRSTGDFP